MTASPTHLSSQPIPLSKVTFSLPNNTNKMSVTQTFYLAHKARGKLSSEASRSDHNLRFLVGHANLLDSLMIRLSEAEAEQERWYQNTVRGNEREWPETADDYEPEEYGSLAADYESDTESESDDDEYEEEEKIVYGSYARTRYPSAVIGLHEDDEDDEDDDEEEEDDEYDDDEEDGMFALTRTTSHRPPSLCSDESDDDEDEAHPLSPPQPAEHFPLSKKELDAVSYFDEPIHDSDATDVLFEQMGLPTMISNY